MKIFEMTVKKECYPIEYDNDKKQDVGKQYRKKFPEKLKHEKKTCRLAIVRSCSI